MKTEITNPKKAMQVTRIIYLAMVAGILFFTAVVFLIQTEPFTFNTNFGDPIFIMLLIVCCIAIPSGYLFTKNLYSKINPSFSFMEKYPIYQSGLIIRMASCEGVALLAIINLLLSNNLINLVVLLLPLSVIISYYPTPEKIGREINLSSSEIEQLANSVN